MPAAAPARSDRLGQAVALMLTYVALIVYVNACGKVMGERFHPFEITLFRHGTAFLFVTLAFLPRHGPRVFVPKRPWLQIPRGLCGICSSLCYFAGLTAMSLADAAAISFTTPLIVASAKPTRGGSGARWPISCARSCRRSRS